LPFADPHRRLIQRRPPPPRLGACYELKHGPALDRCGRDGAAAERQRLCLASERRGSGVRCAALRRPTKQSVCCARRSAAFRAIVAAAAHHSSDARSFGLHGDVRQLQPASRSVVYELGVRARVRTKRATPKRPRMAAVRLSLNVQCAKRATNLASLSANAFRRRLLGAASSGTASSSSARACSRADGDSVVSGQTRSLVKRGSASARKSSGLRLELQTSSRPRSGACK
jgi:hypothetical protein